MDPVSDMPKEPVLNFITERDGSGWYIILNGKRWGPVMHLPGYFGNKKLVDELTKFFELSSDKEVAQLCQWIHYTQIMAVSPEGEGDRKSREDLEAETEMRLDTEGIYEKFFDGDKQFVPKRLGDDALKCSPFLTNLRSREIFVYREGFWQPIGEQAIEQHCKKMLGDLYKIHRAVEVTGYIRASTYAEPKEPEQCLINVENGVLDLDAEVLIPHSPKFMFFQKIPVKYDPEAKCPLIDKFLTDVSASKEDKTVLEEWIGYNLLRSYPIQKSLMSIGEGANGKSTYLNLMKNFLGPENVVSKSLQDLENHRFAKASLFGKLANISPDLPDIALKRTGTFKALTGSDPIDGEKKFKDSFPFWNYAKLSFSCNKMPQVDDNTDAFFRRWLIAVFPNKFEGENCDQNILDKLCTPQELSGLLNVALEALKRILKQRGFSYSQTTEQVRIDYIAKSDPMGGFVQENLENDANGEIVKKEMYDLFCAYCREKNLPIVNSDTFFKNLPKYITYDTVRIQQKSERYYAFRGIRLTEDGEKIKDRTIHSTQTKLENVSRASRASRVNISLNHSEIVKEEDIGKTLDAMDALATSEVCFLCNESLPKDLKGVTYFNGKRVHVRCANESYRERSS